MSDWSRLSTQPDEDQGSSGLFNRRASKRKPINMSVIKKELRVVLLGSHADVKASCGNTIFGRKVFLESQSSLNMFERHDGTVLERHVVVINTPDLLNPALYPEEQDLKRCFRLSCPEPHALLLLLKSGTFTEQENDAFKLINIIFGAGASEYVIVVFIHEEQEYVSVKDSDNELVKSPLQTSRRPHHHLRMNGERSQVQNLLENIEKMVEENGGHHLKISDDPRPLMKTDAVFQTSEKTHKGFSRMACSVNQRPDTLSQQPKSEIPKSENPFVRSRSKTCTKKSLENVRMVLIGKTGVGKSATGNTILGRDLFQSRGGMKSVTKTCQGETGNACGRAVTVVDTPGLFDTTLSNEEIQQEIMRCFELSAPGPHVFLLVIAIGPITQEERETLELIKMTFGQKAEAYTMVLFTHGDKLSDESIEDYVKEGDQHVQKLIHECGGRFHVFNNKQKDRAQVVSLLKKIDKMMWSNRLTFYNDKMFQEAERVFRLMQMNREREEEVRREIEALKAKHQSEIREIQDKLEEEKAKVRENQILEKGNTHLTLKREDMLTTEPEQTQDQNESKSYVERKNDDQVEKKEDLMEKEDILMENQLSEMADLERETLKTERGFDKDRKKIGKKWRVFETLKRGKKQRKKIEMAGECKTKETASEDENVEKIKDPVTDQQISRDLPKVLEEEKDAEKERLLQRCEEMEECRQKMEEAMRRYKETADMYAAELKRIEARNSEILKNNHKKSCVLL